MTDLRRPISDAEWHQTRRTITRSVQAERLYAGRAAALARMPRGCAERVFVLGCTTSIDHTAALLTLPAGWDAPPPPPGRSARAFSALRAGGGAIGCLALAGAAAGLAIGAGVLLGLGGGPGL
jgi:hypothetical protein